MACQRAVIAANGPMASPIAICVIPFDETAGLYHAPSTSIHALCASAMHSRTTHLRPGSDDSTSQRIDARLGSDALFVCPLVALKFALAQRSMHCLRLVDKAL